MKQNILRCLCLTAALAPSIPGAHARGQTITQFPLPRPNSGPAGITRGTDGAVWFTELFANRIGRFTPEGVLTEFAAPPGSGPFLITAGPDGALWFTESNTGKIGRITISGVVSEVAVGAAQSDITTGPDGALWFTLQSSSQIGRLTLSGQLTKFNLPLAGSSPHGIAVGSDEAIWFTEFDGNRIGRITVSGEVTEFSVPSPGVAPSGIARAPMRQSGSANDAGLGSAGSRRLESSRSWRRPAAEPSASRSDPTAPSGMPRRVADASDESPRTAERRR